MQEAGRQVVVLEDGASAHNIQFDREFLVYSDIVKILWPGNSPNINTAEHAWPGYSGISPRSTLPARLGSNAASNRGINRTIYLLEWWISGLRGYQTRFGRLLASTAKVTSKDNVMRLYKAPIGLSI